MSPMEPAEIEKANARCEIIAKIILVSVTSAALAGICCLLILVTMTTPFLKVTIGVIGVAVLLLSLMGWKLISASFEPVILPPPNTSVLLRSYAFDSSFSSTFRPPRVDIPFTIPRPIISPDPYGPPTRLAPPPPSYDLSQTVANSTAPPPYSNNGILRRSASNSPPPLYNHEIAINSPPPQRTRIFIDCSKAVPTLYAAPQSETVI